MFEFDPVGPLVVISPHLDDAVLSCGHLLNAHPSTTVVTVLAGAPDVTHEGYNSRSTGKTYAPDAVGLRRDEDRSAMESLGAIPVWLDLLDADYEKYRPTTDYVEVIKEALSQALHESDAKSVVAPLGLIHVDHLAVSEACISLAAESPLTWYLYMDLPYGLAIRRLFSKRLRAVRRRIQLEELAPYKGDSGVKQRAMNLYESQYLPTRMSHPRGFDATMKANERYWRIEGFKTASSPR